VATGGGDGYVRIWDAGKGSEPCQTKIPNCRSISALSFNQVGSMLACAGTDLEITLLKMQGGTA